MGAGSTPSLLLFDLMVALKQLIREWTGDHPLGPLATIRGNPVHHDPFDPSQRPWFLWHFECCWLQLHANAIQVA
jgi:hypothetical protein